MSRAVVRKEIVIAVVGETGSGKSHLIRTLFGDGEYGAGTATTHIGAIHGTQDVNIIPVAWDYNNAQYQVKLIDTQGLLDNNRNQLNSSNIAKRINAEIGGVNYLFIVIRRGRYTVDTRNQMQDLFRYIRVSSSRIKILITYCEHLNENAKQRVMDEFSRSGYREFIGNAAVHLIGSYEEADIVTEMITINNSLKDNTVRTIMRICLGITPDQLPVESTTVQRIPETGRCII